MIKCDQCPRAKDVYPDKLDLCGYHYHICGMSGNIVYTTPHRIKRAHGSGWINIPLTGCGLYETVEDALEHMTKAERDRWEARHK